MIFLIDETNADLHRPDIEDLLEGETGVGLSKFRLTPMMAPERSHRPSSYISMLSEGRMAASVTLTRADGKTPTASPQFGGLKLFKALPSGTDVFDISDFVVTYDEDDKSELARRTYEMLCGIYEFALAEKTKFFISVISAPLFSTLVLAGIPARAVSFPVKNGDGLIIAVEIPVHETSLHALYRLTHDEMPRLRLDLPQPTMAAAHLPPNMGLH